MIDAALIFLQLCLDGAYLCTRDIPPKPIYREPEKSCYVDGVFYPRCADYDNPEVKYYHNLLKGK
jgi:hypothetical protein